MHSTQDDENSHFKLAQVWEVTSHITGSTSEHDTAQRIIEEILTDDVNINHKVTINHKLIGEKIQLDNCTALHFTYCGGRDVYTFNYLLERGADYTIKNGNGQTALHLVIHDLDRIRAQYDIPFINSVLSAHVKAQSAVNPHDDNGISHLHGTCITNHVEAAHLFLENGASVDEAVNLGAPKFAGYTPLHFAAVFQSFEVAKLLVSRGANVNAKDAEGLTPLDMAVKCRLDKFEYVNRRDFERDDDYKQNFWKKIAGSEKIIELLLEQSLLTLDFSKFHVACNLMELTLAENVLNEVADINQAISMESTLRPGDTALHFAAENSVDAVKMLMKCGAKMDVENALGLTPLDICVNRYNITDIFNVLSCDENWNNVRMTDEKTRLLDFIRATAELDQFKLFFKNNKERLAVLSESLVLPGSTVLHLAVIFSVKTKAQDNSNNSYNDSIVKECLEKNLDINAQNAKGQTPIHLAFRLGKENIVNLLLERLNEAVEVMNLVDEDNLSYLHIACAMKNETLVEELVRTSSPNVTYTGNSMLMGLVETGSTPLHLATAKGSHTIAEMLLRHGADLHATDANNMTPIHWILHLEPENTREIANVLFDSLFENLQDHVVRGVGLSYLHVASYAGDIDAVENLLRLGSRVNVPIVYENFLDKRHLNQLLNNLVKYSSYTPLHLSQLNPVVEVIDLLLRRGADFFAEVSDKKYWSYWAHPLDDKEITCIFMPVLWDQSDLQKRMEDRFGLTRLHIACHMKNEEAIKSALRDGIDVNAQVHVDSEIFAESTPLHLLVTISNERFDEDYNELALLIEPMVKLLLRHGAEVTIANSKKETPLHVFSWNKRHFADGDLCKNLLSNAQQDFSVNPVNKEGLSHFHLACQWHQPQAVKKFVQQGSVDINRPIDYFATFDGGSTPLHLALDHEMSQPNVDWTNLLKIVDVLLEYGADVNAKDVRGETPLHKPAVWRSPCMSILDKLLGRGADIKSKNIKGKTSIDKHIDFLIHDPDYASLLRKYNYPINSWNNLTGHGSIGKIFTQHREDIAQNTQFRNFIESLQAQMLDEMGRTVIHNSVAISSLAYVVLEYYIYAFEIFIARGVDIDHQDQSGQTALHYAARMENDVGTEALLAYGADLNVIDSAGKSALSYVVEYHERGINTVYSHEGVLRVFNVHVKKLQHLELEVSQLNHNLMVDLRFNEDEDLNVSQLFFTQVEMAKAVDIGVGSLTLSDFLNETGGITLYPYLSISERAVIDDFFKSVSREEYSELIGIIKLQFRKMKARLELIDPALASLRELMGFSVPGLCENILRFLLNSDIKNLIDSAV